MIEATRERGGFVRDPRHRLSLELRPSDELDGLLRGIARELEHAGLLHPGATRAPRFHPHLTLLRAASIGPEAPAMVAAALASSGGMVQFDVAGAFGFGRIVHVMPSDSTPLVAARCAAVAAIPADALDPLVLGRDWTPHVSLAYAVPEPARAAALEHVAACLPTAGRWASVQVWDLDVRPTRLLARVPLPPGG